MANTARGAGVTQPRPVVENIVPSSGWTEDPSGHYLLIDLPGNIPKSLTYYYSN